jgi:hypothetical protein
VRTPSKNTTRLVPSESHVCPPAVAAQHMMSATRTSTPCWRRRASCSFSCDPLVTARRALQVLGQPGERSWRPRWSTSGTSRCATARCVRSAWTTAPQWTAPSTTGPGKDARPNGSRTMRTVTPATHNVRTLRTWRRTATRTPPSTSTRRRGRVRQLRDVYDNDNTGVAYYASAICANSGKLIKVGLSRTRTAASTTTASWWTDDPRTRTDAALCCGTLRTGKREDR